MFCPIGGFPLSSNSPMLLMVLYSQTIVGLCEVFDRLHRKRQLLSLVISAYLLVYIARHEQATGR